MYANAPHEWTRRTMTTIGEACRAVKGELLERLVDWTVDRLNDDVASWNDIRRGFLNSGFCDVLSRYCGSDIDNVRAGDPRNVSLPVGGVLCRRRAAAQNLTAHVP